MQRFEDERPAIDADLSHYFCACAVQPVLELQDGEGVPPPQFRLDTETDRIGH